jgi:hypothetical protein
MSFINTLKAFLEAPKGDTVAITVHDAFMTASELYDAVSAAVDPYTTRAKHRYTIISARIALSKATPDDPSATTAYEEAVSAYTDPADFEPYTEAYIKAHTAALDTLTTAFNNLTAAFSDFNAIEHSDKLYNAAAAVYKAYCDCYIIDCDAYSAAAYCALITASEGNLRAAKDEYQIFRLECRTANAAAEDLPNARAKITALKVKVAEEIIKSKQLEQIGRIAQTKAEEVLSKARTYAAIAEKAFEGSK